MEKATAGVAFSISSVAKWGYLTGRILGVVPIRELPAPVDRWTIRAGWMVRDPMGGSHFRFAFAKYDNPCHISRAPSPRTADAAGQAFRVE